MMRFFPFYPELTLRLFCCAVCAAFLSVAAVDCAKANQQPSDANKANQANQEQNAPSADTLDIKGLEADGAEAERREVRLAPFPLKRQTAEPPSANMRDKQSTTWWFDDKSKESLPESKNSSNRRAEAANKSNADSCQQPVQSPRQSAQQSNKKPAKDEMESDMQMLDNLNNAIKELNLQDQVEFSGGSIKLPEKSIRNNKDAKPPATQQ